jgi:hypothetical protein
VRKARFEVSYPPLVGPSTMLLSSEVGSFLAQCRALVLRLSAQRSPVRPLLTSRLIRIRCQIVALSTVRCVVPCRRQLIENTGVHLRRSPSSNLIVFHAIPKVLALQFVIHNIARVGSTQNWDSIQFQSSYDVIRFALALPSSALTTIKAARQHNI